MTFCPVGAVQDTASDVDVAVALMFVAGSGSVQSHSTILTKLLIGIDVILQYVFCVCMRACVFVCECANVCV